MNVNKVLLNAKAYPECLRQISSPPKQLFVAGPLEELLGCPCVAIVGSRKISAYGKQVTRQLATDLAQAGLVIVSGLAFGVDAASHTAALEAGGKAIAVLPTSLEHIYPASNRNLAKQILASGGALVSEYAPEQHTNLGNFVARNRIIAGLSKAVVITEAALKSGSLHTARYALEQGKDVLAVPGNITSPTSEGTNNLIKSGATPVTCADDVLHIFGLDGDAKRQVATGDTDAEQIIINLLKSGKADANELLAKSNLGASEFNQTLTMLEIKAYIRPLGNNRWTLS